MEIRKIPIEKLNPAAYNPRKDLQPGDPEYEKLKRSMQEFGSMQVKKLFYKRKEWKRKRRQILERDNYECQRCKRDGGYSRATTVHHIKHLEQFPELALADENLESLCGVCHNIEHPEKLKRLEVEQRKQITPERW
jgi:5-methylcytosine-specific restriction protein A